MPASFRTMQQLVSWRRWLLGRCLLAEAWATRGVQNGFLSWGMCFSAIVTGGINHQERSLHFGRDDRSEEGAGFAWAWAKSEICSPGREQEMKEISEEVTLEGHIIDSW